MKKSLIALLVLVGVGFGMEITTLQKVTSGTVSVVSGATTTAVEISFTCSESAALMFAERGKFVQIAKTIADDGSSWLELDGTKIVETEQNLLEEIVRGYWTSRSGVIAVNAGTHSLSLKLMAPDSNGYSSRYNGVLEIMLIVGKDSVSSSVMESPGKPRSTDTKSVIAFGSVLSLPGCTRIVDVSGRIVSLADKVGNAQIDQLSTGTYFAQMLDGTTVKVVKVK